MLEGLRGYGLRTGDGRDCLKWMGMGLAVPYAIYGLGLALALAAGLPIVNPVSALGGTPLGPEAELILLLITAAIAGLTANALVALGEELGWRGLLLEELRGRLGQLPTAIVIGVLWALWHAPLVLLLGYNYPRHRALGLLAFTAICIAWSAIMNSLKERSGSLLPPAVMHGVLNALGSLMRFSVPVDALVGLPVGLLALVPSALIAIAIALCQLEKGH